jgi:hypothetical protein
VIHFRASCAWTGEEVVMFLCCFALQIVPFALVALKGIAAALSRAFAAVPPRVDGLLGGDIDAWRFWCPPVLDTYGEYDLLLCLDDLAASGVRNTGRGAAPEVNSAADPIAS